ncbi:MAG: Ku protein [Syntrophobacterales bacterium]
MRTIWKGYIKFSLVSIPIKMYTATSHRIISFDLLHKDCGTKIKQERLCPHCDKVLSNDELVRGYKYGKDMYVIVTDEDIEAAQKESTDAIEIMQFVDDKGIHPIYYTDSHYLVPDGKAGTEAFALLHKALLDLKKSAVAKVVMRNREYLYAIKPYNGTLIAFTLHFPEEIIPVDKVEEAEELQKIQVDEKNLSLAKTLVENLSGDFVPEDYQDDYSQTLLKIIQAKAEGEEYQVEARAEGEKVINLMEALQRSVEQATGERPKPKEAEKKRKTG